MSDFKPMLAKDAPLDSDGNVDLEFPLFVQPKLDGIRATVVNGRLLSRTLKDIPNDEIRTALSKAAYEGLDGELIVGDPTAPDCYRRTASFVMAKSKTGESWAFYVFDVWGEDAIYSHRRNVVSARCGQWDWTGLPIFAVDTFDVHDAAELEAYEQRFVEAGHEGAILRTVDGQYKFGRSGKKGPLLKLKRFVDFEAEVIGVYEEQHNANEAQTNALGRTERSSAASGKVGKGTLGGLYLKALNGPCEGVEFKCGTGFDAADRIALWAQAQYGFAADGAGLNGQIAKVKSFPIGVKEKPRHPVFLGFRDMEVDG